VRFTGPKVLVINEMNFSAAETFPLMFDIADVGTIVGMRTGGGGTGTALHYPDLIDGGRIAIPNRAGYNPRTGEWAENNGVSPDVEVQLMPEDFVAGRDPQLERAVAIAMERAKNEEPYKPKRPAYVKHP
jgi:tricorn protease